MFQIIRISLVRNNLKMTAWNMSHEVKEFNADVATRFKDQAAALAPSFSQADKHQKMLLLHSPLTANILNLLQALKNQTPKMYVVYFGEMQLDQRQILDNILGNPKYLAEKNV